MPAARKNPAPKAWPADRVESWPIDRLKPYERNARTHSDAQIEQIAESIKEWGWTVPVLATKEGRIIAGHGRVEAGRRIGLTAVPVMVADGWTDAQVRAYTLADNRLTLNAEWDVELLGSELGELRDLGVDLESLGFDAKELEGLLGANGDHGDPEKTPEPPVFPISELGDVWLLGRHRVICGDSTVATDVARLLGDVRPLLMVTDPPYGVSYDATHRRGLQSKNSKPAQGAVANDDQADWRDAWALFSGDVAYVWHAGNKAHIVAESLLDCGLEIRGQVVWAKSKFVIGRGHYHGQHEPCWYAVRKGGVGNWQGSRKESTLWSIEHRKSETGHSTQKPVECMRRPIENNSSPGQVVYDPFLGSGTTIIAAEMAGRACYGLELNPAYVDVIVERWQTFVGQQATLEGDGRTFEEVKRERQKADPDSAAPGEGESREASAPAARGKSRARRAGTSAVPQ